MRTLNPDQLRTLLEVTELGSFTAAAERLSLTQPAISLQIQELEQRLGVRLVERLGKKAFATAAGREVVEHARRILAETEAITAAMRRYREGFVGRVRLGTGPNILAYLLPSVLKQLRNNYPDIEINTRAGITRDMLGRLLRNELDLVVATLPIYDKRLTFTPMRRDALLAVLPDTQSDAPASIAPVDFAERTLVLDGRSQMDQMIRDWMRAGGVEPKPAMELGSPEAIRNVVAAGLGVTILSPEVLTVPPPAGGVVVRPLRPPIIRELALVQREDKQDESALRIVREALMILKTAQISPGATHEIIQPVETACTHHSRQPACDAPAC